MIEYRSVSRRFSSKLALDDVSFIVPDGSITGLVGPNGAGKTTAMKILAGLLWPSAGTVLIDGKPFKDAALPMSTVGAFISPEWIPKGRAALDILLSLAATHRIAKSRCHDLLAMVGLGDVATHRVHTFSFGMRQRLGIAIALLGDPKHLVLDEPVAGLDPEGVVWVRKFLKSYATEGKSVLLSSHLMAELENTADRVVILSGGRVAAQDTVASLVSSKSETTYVESGEVNRLIELLELEGYAVSRAGAGVMVEGVSAPKVAEVAHRGGVLLSRLESRKDTLEDVFFGLTGDASKDPAEVV